MPRRVPEPSTTTCAPLDAGDGASGAADASWLTGKLLEGDVPVRALVDEALDERDQERLAAALEPIEHGVQRGGTLQVLVDRRGARRSRSNFPHPLDAFEIRPASPRDRAGQALAIGIILVGLLATFVPAMPIVAVGAVLASSRYAAAGLVA